MADLPEGFLFHVPQRERVKTFKRIEHPIWTNNKAKLIERYLYYFAWVTRHGTYIDGFAGPQRIENQDMWSAKLVLANRPRFLRNFLLFDIDPVKVALLHQLKEEQPPLKKNEKRSIEIYAGDFNRAIVGVLKEKPIKASEASFCLLDQRTFQCDWKTVVFLAKHKPAGSKKIELFYFLATGWMHRAASKKKDKQKEMDRWYGNDGWDAFLKLKSIDRSLTFTARFKEELGYKHVYSFPIYGRDNKGVVRTMYWMIHASDDERAPGLMHSAYQFAETVKEDKNQIQLLSRQAENLAACKIPADNTHDG
jgi:three-Cys-motif partner protein